MKIRAEFYNAPEKAFAFHPMPGKPDHMQFWYIDANLDHGYTFQTVWSLQENLPAISVQVQCPDGRAIDHVKLFEPAEATASSETCDVKMGESRFHGRFPNYELHFGDGDVGFDLVYESKTPMFMEPSDGVFIGREQAPSTPYYWGFVIMPRCEVSGNLTVDGKTIPVSGKGYLEHSWLNQPNFEITDFASWCKLYARGYTLMFWSQVLGEAMGFQSRRLLWVWKDDQLIEYNKNVDMYLGTDDFEVDPETGLAYPKKLEIMIDDQRVNGIVKFEARDIAFKTPAGIKNRRGDTKRYFRFRADCHAHLTIGGEDVEFTGPEIYEMSL